MNSLSPATRPRPKPGILDIAPYIPGKSGQRRQGLQAVVERIAHWVPVQRPKPPWRPARMRSNFTRTDRRRSCARRSPPRYGLNAGNIVCGAGSDELLQLLAHGFLMPGDEAVYSQYGFLVYPIAIMANCAKPVVAPETEYHANVDALLAAVTRQDAHRLPRQSQQSDRNLSAGRAKSGACMRGCRENACSCIDAAYAEYVRRNDYESGIELVSTFENVVMTRTFSKIHGLAGLQTRLGLLPGPYRRCAQPHPRPFQCIGGRARGGCGGTRRPGPCRPRACP